METTAQLIIECQSQEASRIGMWSRFIKQKGARRIAEIGVYRGEFARQILEQCDCIERYYMLDPWRHLGDWNKPSNLDNQGFDAVLSEATAATDFAAGKRVILRGTTTEVIDSIQDGELDFAYIDGDHTLRGITIDLIRVYPKLGAAGLIAGDDFTTTIWQHSAKFEPSLVFPLSVYFAEAVGAKIYALPHSQFLLEKNKNREYAFIDLTGAYKDISLLSQCGKDGFCHRISDNIRLITTKLRKQLRRRL